MFKYIITILLLLQGALAFAAPDSSHLLRLNMADGLPSNNIYSILQDRNGYLWFTTDNGLAKYNGYSMKIFNATHGLPNEMFGMYEDADGRIWVDYYGYELVYIRDNAVKTIDYKFTQRFIRSFRILERKRKAYFYHSDIRPTLVEIDSNDHARAFPLDAKTGALFQHPDSTKFLTIRDNDLFECELLNNKITSNKLCKLPEPIATLPQLKKNLTDSCYFSFSPRGNKIYFFNVYTCTQKTLDITDLGAEESEGIYLAYSVGKVVYIITNKSFYIVGFNRELLDKRNVEFTPGLSQVSFYLHDKSLNDWFATTADGAFMKAHIPPIFTANKSLSALSESINVGVAPTGNTYWWSSKQKKLYGLDADMNIRFIESFPNQDIQYVLESSASDIYIATTQSILNAVFVYNIPTRQKKYFADDREYVLQTMHLDSSVRKNDFSQQKHNALRSLFNLHEYKPGVYFATNRAQGLMKITRTKDSLDIQHYLMDRCPNLLYDSIHNKYWLYNKEKLILYDPENGNHLTMPAVLLKKLQIHSISKIQYDQYHNIYILTDRQIVILNTRTNELRYIKTNVDLANAFMAIHDNVLLIAGKFGIGYSLIKGPLAVTRFNVIHNIKGHYYNRISGFVVTANRNIVVATDKGTYSFRISDLLTATTKAYAKKADIMQLVISYPEQYAVHPSDTFYLPQETEKINFDFINFYGNGPREYSYKFEGDPRWQTTEAGEVFVGDIKPGKYYKMQCFVKDEIWKSNTYAFYLYRLPYWYQTPTWRIIFWISGAFLFVVLVAAIILLTKNIVARANEKKRLLTELELRAIHAQINPHFIFNTLGSALYFISKKKMDEAYLHVNKFSKLLRSYLRSSRNRYIALSDEIEMLRNYIELQQIRFESKFDYIIDVENKIATNSVQIPSLLLQPLVENAINHGLFHLAEGKKGLLAIRFYQGTSSNELICTIDDNGVGRQKAREIKRTSDAQYESVGTKLTEELINIFKQYENMNIYLEYIDKPEPETGTIVKLTIRNLKYVA